MAPSSQELEPPGFPGRFKGFGGGDRNKRVVGANAATACHACHVARKDHGYVFSAPRD